MKFSQLDKESQDFLIDQLNIQIEESAIENGVDNYDDLSFDDYEEFFNNYDEDYEMIDGYPRTTVPLEVHAKYSIEFDNGKVILNTFELE